MKKCDECGDDCGPIEVRIGTTDVSATICANCFIEIDVCQVLTAEHTMWDCYFPENCRRYGKDAR